MRFQWRVLCLTSLVITLFSTSAWTAEWEATITATSDTQGVAPIKLTFGVDPSLSVSNDFDNMDEGHDSPFLLPLEGQSIPLDAAFIVNKPFLIRLKKDIKLKADSNQWQLEVRSDTAGITLRWDVSRIPSTKSVSLITSSGIVNMRLESSPPLSKGRHILTLKVENSGVQGGAQQGTSPPTGVISPVIVTPTTTQPIELKGVIRVPDFGDINTAISLANSQGGGAVIVAPGEYIENIRLEPGVMLIGSGADVTVIKEKYAGIGYVVKGANNSLISGFTITGGTNDAGIYCENVSSMHIINNKIINNSTGILLENSSPKIIGNQISGGVYCWNGSSPLIKNNIIFGNKNITGISCSNGSSPTIVNNVIVQNVWWGIQAQDSSSPVIMNNIIFGNGENDIVVPAASNSNPIVTYNLIGRFLGITLGAGNILGKDPLFVDANNRDYRLRSGSPAIDAGNPDLIYNDNSDTQQGGPRNDMGAYGGPDGKHYAPPVADFSLPSGQNFKGDAPFKVIFRNNSFGEAKTYLWDFGDGETSTEQTPTHIYTKDGIFNVSLTAVGPGGVTKQTKERYIYATRPIPPPPPLKGDTIAFRSSRDGNSGIYLMNADGTNQIRISLDSAFNDDLPAWSPDRTQIVFRSNRESRGNLFVMKANGTDVRRLTDIAGMYPSWSPDGSKIAFTSPFGNQDIYLVNADGTNLTRLTDHPASDRQPSWSPHGEQIVFVSNRDRNPGIDAPEIYMMDADGTNQRRLTNTANGNHSPSWSPDGTKIALVSSPPERGGDYEIYVMNSDGTNQIRLTNNPELDYWPTWSPDGKKIAFVARRHGFPNDEIYVMDADGRNQTRLTNNAALDDYPAWSPPDPTLLPPRITKFRVVGKTFSSITVEWISLDDVSTYQILVATDPNLSGVIRKILVNLPQPKRADRMEIKDNLSPNTMYYFAIRVRGEASKWSASDPAQAISAKTHVDPDVLTEEEEMEEGMDKEFKKSGIKIERPTGLAGKSLVATKYDKKPDHLPDKSKRNKINKYWEIEGPTDSRFFVDLVFPYTLGEIETAGLKENTMVIAYHDGSDWKEVVTKRDPNRKVLWTTTTHLSAWIITEPTVSASKSTVTLSPTTVRADNNATATISITLLNENGNPVSDKIVKIDATGTGNTITPTSATTDVTGKATFSFKSTKAESKIITVTDDTDSLRLTSQPTVTFISEIPSASKSTVSAITPIPVDALPGSTVTVVLKDQYENLVTNKSFNIKATIAPDTGVVEPTTSFNATTDSNGQFTFIVKSTKAEDKVLTVTVSSAEMGTIELAQKPVIKYEPGVVSASKSTATAISPVSVDNPSGSTVTVVLKDQYENLIPTKNVNVNVTVNPSAGITLVPSSSFTITTNANGQFTFTVKSTKAEEKTLTVTVGTVELTQKPVIKFDSGAVSAANSIITPSASTISVDDPNGIILTLTLMDGSASKNLITGRNVTVNAITVTPNTGVTLPTLPLTLTPNAEGKVSFAVKATKAEAKTVSITVDNIALTSITLTTFIHSVPDSSKSLISLPNPPIYVDDVNGATVSLTLKDKFDNPIKDRAVTFNSITVTPNTGVTLPTLLLQLTPNAEGKVSFAVKATKAEAKTLSITIENVSLSNITITFEPGPPDASKTTFTFHPTPILVDDINGTNMTITLKDKFENLIKGREVNISSISINPNTGVTLPDLPLRLTPTLEGKVSFVIKSTKAEQKTVSITMDGVALQTQTIEFNPASPEKVEVTSDKPELFIGQVAKIMVMVKDKYNNLIKDANVSITATSELGKSESITPVTISTDGSYTTEYKPKIPGKVSLKADASTKVAALPKSGSIELVVPSRPPTASASEISGFVAVMYPGVAYNVSCIYKDADGYTDIKEMWLRLDNGDFDVVLKASGGESAVGLEPIIESGNIYLKSKSYTYDRESSGNQIKITWHYALNWNWTESSTIRYAVKCSDNSNRTSIEDTSTFTATYENDLTFLGTLIAQGEIQGNLNSGSWVRGEEKITWTGLKVVFENSTLSSNDTDFDIEITDDDGTSWKQDKGAELNLQTTADIITDPEDVYSFKIVNIPQRGSDVSKQRWALKIDADPPTDVGCKAPDNNAKDVPIHSFSLLVRNALDLGSGLAIKPYYIELATDNRFTQDIQASDWIGDVVWNPVLQPEKPYYWRVKAKDKVGNESKFMGHIPDVVGYGTFTTTIEGITLLSNNLAIAGQAKLIKARISLKAPISSVNLYYLTGGQPAFFQQPMYDDGLHDDSAPNDGIFAREIPAIRVNMNGLAFYVAATDVNGQTTDTINQPAGGQISLNTPAVVEVVGNITGPEADDGKTYGDITAYDGIYTKGQILGWKSKADWTIISFPFILPDPDPEKVFAQWGTPEVDWQAYQFNGGTDYDRAIRIPRPNDPRGDVEKFPSIQSGKAAWIWPGDNPRTITLKGAKAHDPTKPFAIMINSGWNQIGNPFRFARVWDKTVKFGMTNNIANAVDINTASKNGLIEAPAIIYLRSGLGYTRIVSPDDSGAIPTGTVKGNLEPWQGYWFLAKRDGWLFIDPTVKGPTSIPPEVAPELGSATYFKGWTVEFNASGIRINAGMEENAVDGQDNLDFPSPPLVIGDSLRFAFAHPEWNNKFAIHFDQDIRSLSRDGATWDIDVMIDSKPVTITWRQIYKAPREYMLILVDPTTGASVDLRKETSYTITGEGSRKLYFVASIGGKGIPEFLAKLMVKKSELLQNFPNPFNPETWVPYQLAGSTDVTIRIYDVGGKLVRTLNLGRNSPGIYASKDRAAYWDGRNELGEPVTSGLYFYELTAGDFRSVKKMVILK